MKIILSAALLLLVAPALAAPDYAGRWEVSGRQFGMFPFFQPINDGRLEIAAGADGAYTARYNALRFTGALKDDGLHLDCITKGVTCGSIVLHLAGGKLSGGGTIGGEPIDITGHRPATRPWPEGKHHEFMPKQFHTLYSDTIPPALRIFPGDSVHTETVDNRGYDGKGVFRSAHGNPLTGPFYVEGAMPGDTLVVHLNKVRTNRDSAFQSNAVTTSALNPGYVQTLPPGDGLTEWRIDAAAGTAALAKPGEHLRDYTVALEPMLGCIGVAPPRDQALASSNLGPWGGNLDSRMIREGSTVYLPVFQPGALLYVGDTHAQQGDGELPGQAMETSMDVAFSVEVIEAKSLGQVWAQDKDDIAVMGVGGSLDDALRQATTGMSLWLTEKYHLTPVELAAVLGSAMHYEIAEVVDPQINVVAKIRKTALAQIHS